MKIKSNSKKLFLIALVFSAFMTLSFANAANTAYFADATLDPDVQAANQSFLSGDFSGMALHIKSAILDNPDDEAMKTNLLSLLSRSYEIGGVHAISADWKLPASILYMMINDRRTDTLATGKTRYGMSLYAQTKPGVEVEQLQLIEYPGKVIFDKQEGIGGYYDTPDLDGSPSVGMYSEAGSEKPSGGLYFLNIKLKGSDLLQGWFLLTDDMTSGESPVVSSPQAGQVFETATPTFSWENFFSTQYQSFEQRRFYIGVVQAGPNVDQDTWEFYTKKPSDQTSVKLGSVPGAYGANFLTNGQYVMNLSFREERSFGDLTLTRYSQTKVPFTVDVAHSRH